MARSSPMRKVNFDWVNLYGGLAHLSNGGCRRAMTWREQADRVPEPIIVPPRLRASV